MRMWRSRFDRSGFIRLSGLFGGVILGIVISFSVSGSEEDDYLSALKAEASKVGAPVTGGSADDRLSRESFENELKAKYAGSATFYGKLDAANREEIYQEYRAGATISELRKKIMDRFLHR